MFKILFLLLITLICALILGGIYVIIKEFLFKQDMEEIIDEAKKNDAIKKVMNINK